MLFRRRVFVGCLLALMLLCGLPGPLAAAGAEAGKDAARPALDAGETENAAPGAWEEYYLNPEDSAPLGPARPSDPAAPALPGDWTQSLAARLDAAYPHSGPGWLHAAKNFAVAAVAAGLLCFFCLRLAGRLRRRQGQALAEAARRSLPLAGLGWGAILAADGPDGVVYTAFEPLGGLFAVAAFAALGWSLRKAATPALAKAPAPLARFFPPVALGALLLFAGLPVQALGLIWGGAMLVFAGFIVFWKRALRKAGKLPGLERFAYAGALLLSLAALPAALFGYARLAILVFMLFFALLNLLTLGSALSGLMNGLAALLFNRDKKPLANAAAGAAATPLAWLLALLSLPPWILVAPGARYLSDLALRSDYNFGIGSVDLSKILLIVFLFFLFRALIGLGKTTLSRLPERLPNLESGVIPPLCGALGYLGWGVFILVGLGLLGVNFTSLAVVAGGLSVGIGFGLQHIFSNLVSGLALIFDRTLLVGDYVEVGGVAGTVKDIKMRVTVVETPARALVYVPNSSVISGQLINWTRDSRVVRNSIQVRVAYGADAELVKKLLLEVAGAHPHVLKNPPPAVYFSHFGESSLDFTMNVFLDDFSNILDTPSELRFAIERSFDRHGVKIPFPQLALHLNPAGDSPVRGGDAGDAAEN